MFTAVFGSPLTTRSSLCTAFTSPLRIITAQRIEDVVGVVEAAEEAALAGCYAVLMLSYEAAPAFDYALKTHRPTSPPIACVAVFKQPVEYPNPQASDYLVEPWQPRIIRAEYDAAVSEIHELIRAGSTYQVNYSFPLISNFSGDAFDWYMDLCQAQDAAYSVFLDLGEYKVISLSPELFFAKTGNKVTTKPMKGTMKRGRWPEEDKANALTLANSDKDKAENVMIVDLLRNDLGKVSIAGSVHVPRLFELERFETLWQMTSTVESTLREGSSLSELIAALFPCGSITGAPKIRTMEIIRDLEPYPRGVYTGAIGLIRPGGDCIFNVAIRTILLDSLSGKATFGVGGGITIDSTAEREYEECLVKSTFLSRSPIDFKLFESILLERSQYYLLERHLERLAQSADFFSFEFDQEAVRQSLANLANTHLEGEWKIKVELRKDGQFEVDAQPISNTGGIKRVSLASKPVDSSNRLLFHKTTSRDFYSSELQRRPDCEDIIFWNERGEITESSIANVVVSLRDLLITPPVESGLLAGTFRDELLTEGRITEQVVTIEELRGAGEFYVINSVRKWMTARLVS